MGGPLGRRQPEQYLPMEDLEVGVWYEGHCRNSSCALWTGELFRYQRTKWGDTFWDTIEHPERDDGFDLFFPVRKIDNIDEWHERRVKEWEADDKRRAKKTT